jgi:4-amino-4-deoxy-L-arabinose transferase-like glycosyltransferase
MSQRIKNVTFRKEQILDRNIALAIVVLFIIAVSGLIIYDHDLWNPNEHRVGAIIKEMADSGNLVVPTLNGEPFLQKPPLYHVSAVFIYKLFNGEPARMFRTTSALYGLLTLLACARIGFILGGKRIALASATALVSMAGFLQVSHFIVVDTALVAFVAMSWWAITEYQERKRTVHLILVWVFAAGAFLSKGIIGVALIFPGMLVSMLWLHGWRQIFTPWHIAGLIAFAGISAIWLVPLALRDGGELFRYWIFHENLGRFLGSTHGHHSEGPLFYIPGFFVITLPWSPWLFGQVAGRLRHRKENMSRIEILAICWAGVGLTLLSLADNKRELYAYPLLSPAAILLAAYLGNRENILGNRIWSMGWPFLSLLAVPLMITAYFLGFVDYSLPWFYFIAGSLVAVLGFVAIHRLHAHPGGLGMPAFWIAPCILIVQFAVLYVPASDALVSHRAGMLKIAELIDPDDTPVAYDFGETWVGSFSFYTGRRVILVDSKQDLRDLMSEHPHKIVIVKKKRWPFDKNPEDLGFTILETVQVGRDRQFFVLRLDRIIKLYSHLEGER